MLVGPRSRRENAWARGRRRYCADVWGPVGSGCGSDASRRGEPVQAGRWDLAVGVCAHGWRGEAGLASWAACASGRVGGLASWAGRGRLG